MRNARRSATIKPPIAFVARHCLAAGKWRESKNPQEISLPRGFSADSRVERNLDRIVESQRMILKGRFAWDKTGGEKERVAIVFGSITESPDFNDCVVPDRSCEIN